MTNYCTYRDGLAEQELLPQVKAILILDEDGGRVTCKYHDKKEFPNLGAEAMFEHKLFRKTKNVSFGDGLSFFFRRSWCMRTVHHPRIVGPAVDVVWWGTEQPIPAHNSYDV